MKGTGLMKLPVYEREVLRCALMSSKPFSPAVVRSWVLIKHEAGRQVLKSLESKELIRRIGGSQERSYAFLITEKAVALLHRIE